MAGIIFSLLAGLAVAVQGVMNTRLSEKAGFWLTNAVVHGSGFLLSLILFAIIRDGHVSSLQSVPKGYLLGGTMGVIIVFSVMKGIGLLGPTYSVAILLVSQLLFSMLIEATGFMGSPVSGISWNKALGIGIMVAGIVVMKWK